MVQQYLAGKEPESRKTVMLEIISAMEGTVHGIGWHSKNRPERESARKTFSDTLWDWCGNDGVHALVMTLWNQIRPHLVHSKPDVTNWDDLADAQKENIWKCFKETEKELRKTFMGYDTYEKFNNAD
eukprot:CAMPEP_0201546340 /NCGR_PEP_ID=MMETSP0173_2-20130828/2648_1 /ASSEMBLY_ACC=CAM_ASM_000268 /TAXON_ID=218659 /ORGANISM="Vexillifera sp., Strain DIVA3 564/2" /LENGTH=126 /DNA_ID=CAMNT_0047954973 /DNA_START=57 /DNA_END=437 /DNA_ORIENTATION=+